MAASRSYFAGPNYRFLPADHRHHSAASGDAMMFELDESDVWSSAATARPESPELRKAAGRNSRKAAAMSGGSASLPVNVPDWSKILKGEYRENRGSNGDGDDEYDEEGGDRIPPHEFLARQSARARIASSSVHEGIGRTLKGRDLSRVRNAIWQKTGFED